MKFGSGFHWHWGIPKPDVGIYNIQQHLVHHATPYIQFLEFRRGEYSRSVIIHHPPWQSYTSIIIEEQIGDTTIRCWSLTCMNRDFTMYLYQRRADHFSSIQVTPKFIKRSLYSYIDHCLRSNANRLLLVWIRHLEDEHNGCCWCNHLQTLSERSKVIAT